MAHKGHNYPVHFRRDFNLNVGNNSVGWARAYNVFFVGSTGTVGEALIAKPLVAIEADGPIYPGMKWNVSPVSRAGRTISFLMNTILPPGTADILIGGQLIDSVLGSLGTCRFGALDIFGYTNFNFRWDTSSMTHPSLFFVGPSTFTQCSAVRWPQWNNL